MHGFLPAPISRPDIRAHADKFARNIRLVSRRGYVESGVAGINISLDCL